FPKGDDGWSPKSYPLHCSRENINAPWQQRQRQHAADEDNDDPVADAAHEENLIQQHVTSNMYYAYHLQAKSTDPHMLIFKSTKLFHEFIVDAWASTQQSHLFWISSSV